MTRHIGMYFVWDQTAETSAPLGHLNNRFPSLFELRRTLWPQYEALAGPPAPMISPNRGHSTPAGVERRRSHEIFFWQSVDPKRGVRRTDERRPGVGRRDKGVVG
jgi:hypothetical protein